MQGLSGKCGDQGTNCTAALDGTSSTPAVNLITNQRVSTMSEMHPDLMCSAGRETAFDERRLRAERALDAVMRDRRLSPVLPDNGHLFAVGNAPTDVAGDLTGRWGQQTPNECGIGTVDPAQSEVARQRAMGRLGLGDDH